MTFRLLGMSEEDRLAFEETTGIKTEAARIIVEASLAEASKLMKQTVREVQEVIGPHGSVTRLQAGGVQVSRNGVSVFDSGVLKTTIEQDGDFLAGSDITQPTRTSLVVFVNDQTYNNERMGEGDVLIGDNTSGASNIKFDASEGQLQFRYGQTVNVYMDTDGSLKAGGGAVELDATGITLLAGAYPATAYMLWKLSDGTLLGMVDGWDYAAGSESGIELVGQAKNSSYNGSIFIVANDHSGNNESVLKVQEDNIHAYMGLNTPGAVNTRSFLISSYVSGTNAGNTVLYLDTYSSGAVANGLGTAIGFRIEDSAGNIENAGYILIDWTDKTNGSEDAELKIGLMKAGTLADALIVDPTAGVTAPFGLTVDGAVVLNEAGADKDVRMEGDTEANLFFLDASVDAIGIGTNSPDTNALLDIAGGLKVDSIINDTGLAAGTWTPTLTSVTNIASSGAFLCNYIRVGSQVFFNGRVNIAVTAIGAFTIRMTIPIASNFTAADDANGNGTQPGTGVPNIFSIRENQANDDLQLDGYAQATGTITYRFAGGYIIK
jgi:hypothetical protein